MAAKSRKHVTKANETQIVTTGNTVRIEQPQSSRQHRPKISVVVGPETNPVSGFVDFLREHAVVGLAIGFIIGTQAQGLVKLLIASFIDPAFQLLFGKALSQRTFTLHFHTHAANFGWGSFVYGLLNFVFVMAAIYIIIKSLKLDKLDKPKEDELPL